LTPTLINRDFQNWLKGALAVLFAKEGLLDLVEHEIIDFQRHLLQTVYTQKGIPSGTTCSVCTTANVLSCPTAGFCSKGKRCKVHDSKVPDKKPNKACPNGLCSYIRDAIKNEHRFKGPSWKNTDARKWCSDAFELSKCFLPPDGYSDKTCLPDTDFNGILAVVINNNRFQRKMSVNLGLEPNICTEVCMCLFLIKNYIAFDNYNYLHWLLQMLNINKFIYVICKDLIT
jgi:hypothetical protein